MQSARLLTSGISWCSRCFLRYGRQTVPVLQNNLPHRFMSSGAIPAPTFEGDDKLYAPKIQQIVKEISQLTLLEVADLNELLKKTLKIADAPIMSMAALPAAQVPQDEEEAPVKKQEKVSFTVKLVKFDETKKVALIKEVKNLVSGMNLVQAKKFVESLPNTVRADIPKEEAEKLKETLSAVGGTIEIE